MCPVTTRPKKKRPLIYACSGCSNLAQLANRIAVTLDREQRAEMSCIAGVGGGVPALVKKARSKRPIIALDGCALHCVKSCLAQVGVEPTAHYTFTQYNLKKKNGSECSDALFEEMKARVLEQQAALFE